jgi:hypothetical protein
MKPYESMQLISWRLVLPTCLLIVLLAGCHGVETEEAEHHTPEHMPADYPAAVDRLLALHVEFINGSSRAADEIDVFAETYDIVRWLPMLAADSELKEEPWNRVHAASRSLEEILTAVLAFNGDDRRETYLQHEMELDQLQRALIKVKQQFPTSGTVTAD